MILILSDLVDAHARFVQRRLKDKGVVAIILPLTEVPEKARLTARVSPTGKPRLAVRRELDPKVIDLAQAETIWYRRWVDLGVDPEMSLEDREFAKTESLSMLMSLAVALRDRFWVNDPSSAEASDGGMGKIGHLEVARALGLAIPETLATSDPDEARAFVSQCSAGAIYKPFRTPVRNVVDDAGVKRPTILLTTKLDAAALAGLEGVAQAPCIFQELVPKKFELRVIVMGDKVFACELHSQEHSFSEVDFRGDADMSRTRHVPHDLSRDVGEKLVALNRELGLVYGAFDLIVTPDGRHVFLEVNQQGQFLWLEQYAGLPLLDNFCEMLAQGRPDFRCEAAPHAPGLPLLDG
jgi:glutathione synthase/RimK-type ligase-like ATP-grasp enzyme